MRRKDFWLLSAVEKVLKGFIPSLSHEADGLIFQVTMGLKRIADVDFRSNAHLYTNAKIVKF